MPFSFLSCEEEDFKRMQVLRATLNSFARLHKKQVRKAAKGLYFLARKYSYGVFGISYLLVRHIGDLYTAPQHRGSKTRNPKPIQTNPQKCGEPRTHHFRPNHLLKRVLDKISLFRAFNNNIYSVRLCLNSFARLHKKKLKRILFPRAHF
jgi:hypothetical protein